MRRTILAVGLLILFAAPIRAQTLWELTPYRVQVYVDLTDTPQLTERRGQDVREFLSGSIETLVGSSWNAEVAPPPQELRLALLGGLEKLRTEDLPPTSLSADKVILVRLSADSFGFHLQARELDCRTRFWGTTVSRYVAHPALIASAATDCLLAAFAPLAQVEKVSGKQATLRLRASGLPLRDGRSSARTTATAI
jgi:hypothetical protein